VAVPKGTPINIPNSSTADRLVLEYSFCDSCNEFVFRTPPVVLCVFFCPVCRAECTLNDGLNQHTMEAYPALVAPRAEVAAAWGLWRGHAWLDDSSGVPRVFYHRGTALAAVARLQEEFSDWRLDVRRIGPDGKPMEWPDEFDWIPCDE